MIGWVGLALALLGVAIAQWLGSQWWGVPIWTLGMVFMLVGIFGMQRDIERRASVTFVQTEHKDNGAAPAMSPERRDALSGKDSPPGTDSRSQSGRTASPE